jgi:hypothetical protein
MEENFLKDFVEGEPKFKAEPWYNLDGDCIHYQAADEAVYAERIDSFLTLYRSAIDDRVIGFQVKGIRAILKMFEATEMVIRAKKKADQPVSVIELVVYALKAGDGKPSEDQFLDLASLLPTLRDNRVPIKTEA